MMSAVLLSFLALPLIALGSVYGYAYRKFRERHGVEWTAARPALLASWLSLLAWTLYVVQGIALSGRGTAIFSIITIPFVGIPVAVVVFAVVWGVSVVLLWLLRARHAKEPQKWPLALASGIILLTGGLCGAHAWSVRLQRVARTETSADSLRTLRDSWWTGHDVAVLDELAGNTHTPPDVLAKLASHRDSGVRYGVARNPSTPAPVLEQLYADPYNRTSLAVNPSAPPAMLRKLAHDPDHTVLANLLFNRSVSTDTLEELAKNSPVSKLAADELSRRREGSKWCIMAPPYTWKWARPFTRALDDEAPLEQWGQTPYHFDTQEQCETLRSELVRRESNPQRVEAIKRSGRTGGGYQPPDFYSHTRCVYVDK
jgi:hypothetical protein